LIVWGTSLAAQQTGPAGPPSPGPARPLLLPPVQEVLLPNGLRLIVLEQHRQPVVSLILSMPAGSAFEPEGKEGISDMLAALLTRAAGMRSAAEVAAASENAGGSLGAASDQDYLTIQSVVLASQVQLGFELIGNAVLKPTLDPVEFAELRDRSAAALEARLGDRSILATRVFLAAAYQRQPYARRATPQSVRGISREDLQAFLRARSRPSGSMLVVAGDITLSQARLLATRALGTWNGTRPPALPAAVAAAPPAGIVLVHAGGVKDASIMVGGRTFAGADTGYYAAAVFSELLSDPRHGRLPQALGAHGWTSAASASFLRTSQLGLFQVTATVPTEVADSTLAEIYSQLAAARTALVPADELKQLREKVAGGYVLRMQTVAQVAGALNEARLLGLPATYLSTYPSRILALTAPQIRAVARRAAPEKGFVTVVVGDAARLYAPLARIAPVRIFSADGRPVTLEDIQPKSVPLVIEPGKLVASTDSLAILAEGKSVGMQVTSLERNGDSIRYVEHTELGSVLKQTTQLSFDTTGKMRSLDQNGVVRGRETHTRLTYRDGRVRGSASLGTGDSATTVTVDTTVSQTVIDENGVQAIVPLLKWELNVRWGLEVFAGGENRLRSMTLTAADLTTITVPAGTFECYRADLEGGPQRVSFYVTTGAPHRIVRVEVSNSPVEFVAVNP
jgi:zinc protease